MTVHAARVPLATSAQQKASPSPIVEMAAIVPPSFELPTAPILAYAPVLPNPPPVSAAPPLLEGAPFRAPPVPSV